MKLNTEKITVSMVGTNGLSTKDWTHEIVDRKNYKEVIFKYVSGPGESGFPETLNVKYTYKVYKDEAKLDVVMDAGASGLTPVDLSMHTFFRLGNNVSVKDQTLTIDADYLAQYDDEGCQTVVGLKEVTDDEGVWNFKTAKTIGEDIEQAAELDPASNGYDHIWYFGDNKQPENAEERTKTVDVTLEGNGFALHVTSEDSDAVILYANCWEVKGQKMNDGEEDTQYAAITIEPYTFFTTEQKSIEKLFIDRGHSFSRHITYEFSKPE